MCHHCVIESVKDHMLSRRDLFRTAAAGAAVAAVGSAVTGTPALADGHSNVEDLTHELHEAFPTYFGGQQFSRKPKFTYKDHTFGAFDLSLHEHTGTHIDAPLHFKEGAQSVAEIPVGNLVVPLCVVDIRAKAADNPDSEVTAEDLKAWISTNGPIPDRACVAMNSGWTSHINTDKFRNKSGDDKLHFPGFHKDATNMLLEESKASGIAVDTLSLDYGLSADFAVHRSWLPAGRWGIECIAHLDKVPAKGATLVVGAPKIRGGTGGPSRIFAMV